MNANFACVLSRPVFVLRDDFTSRGFEGRHVLMQGRTQHLMTQEGVMRQATQSSPRVGSTQKNPVPATVDCCPLPLV